MSAAAGPGGGGAPLAVVADDDPDILMLLRLRLERAGWDVSAHSNGADALAAAELERPDLMLLDVMMPQLNGIELTRTVRSHPDPELARTPIVLLTASVQDEHKRAASEVGADRYVRKPFDPSELLATVEELAAPGRGDRSAGV